MTKIALTSAALAALAALPAFAQAPAPARTAPPAAATVAPAAPQARPRGGPMGAGDESMTRVQLQQMLAGQFAEMDGNKDGAITKAELGDHGGPQMFDRLDTNGDGKVTLDEVSGRMLQMFDTVDANKDGTVTPQERAAFRESMRTRMQGSGER